MAITVVAGDWIGSNNNNNNNPEPDLCVTDDRGGEFNE